MRQAADALGIAPGTVARAYAQLEREGVVETGRARGTRVAARPRAHATPGARAERLRELLRPAVVAAYHLGAAEQELHDALRATSRDVYPA